MKILARIVYYTGIALCWIFQILKILFHILQVICVFLFSVLMGYMYIVDTAAFWVFNSFFIAILCIFIFFVLSIFGNELFKWSKEELKK